MTDNVKQGVPDNNVGNKSNDDLINRAEAQKELQLAARRYMVASEAHAEGNVLWSENLISVTDAMNALRKVPSAQPERKRLTNKEWIDFLSDQFDISRTSAREMLHGMMRWKKEDNFKKQFNPGKEEK